MNYLSIADLTIKAHEQFREKMDMAMMYKRWASEKIEELDTHKASEYLDRHHRSVAEANMVRRTFEAMTGADWYDCVGKYV